MIFSAFHVFIICSRFVEKTQLVSWGKSIFGILVAEETTDAFDIQWLGFIFWGIIHWKFSRSVSWVRKWAKSAVFLFCPINVFQSKRIHEICANLIRNLSELEEKHKCMLACIFPMMFCTYVILQKREHVSGCRMYIRVCRDRNIRFVHGMPTG